MDKPSPLKSGLSPVRAPLTPEPEQVFQCTIAPTPLSTTDPNRQITVLLRQGEFFLRLNESLIQRIQLARQRKRPLTIPEELLAALRRYTLLDDRGRPQSGLTFSTYYEDSIKRRLLHPGLTSGQIILRTIVSLDGDVIHQILEDYLYHPECLEIVQSHYWLVNQLLGSLRASTLNFIDRLTWGIATATVASAIAINLGLNNFAQHPELALQTVGASAVSFLLPLGWTQFKGSLSPKINRFLLGQLVSRSPLGRALAKHPL